MLINPAIFGGRFLTPPDSIKLNLKKTTHLIFDWDGVFNDARKSATNGSGFSEPDSMGLNMLRFAFWLETGNILPIGIITGEPNESAEMLAKREHFNNVYFGVKDKAAPFKEFCAEHGVNAANTIMFYDDIIDLSVVKLSGLRVMINRPGHSAFEEYIVKNHLADYITHNHGGQYALREAFEVFLVIMGSFEKVIDERVMFTDKYQSYLKARDEVKTSIVKWKADKV
jgi:3-deoxy-D-manno-octulosonate 8-phosphate phosphatase (KDO 8-P phosphatase)